MTTRDDTSHQGTGPAVGSRPQAAPSGAGTTPARPTALLLAYACKPQSGSEPQVGWDWSLAAAEVCERVVVLTDLYNKPFIEAVEAPANVGFRYVDVGPLASRIAGHGGPFSLFNYASWCHRARAAARTVLAEDTSVTVVHHLTYASDWWPSPLRSLGRPFVWGPVGGSNYAPVSLLRHVSARAVLTELVRLAVTKPLRRVGTRGTARSATTIVLSNQDGRRNFAKYRDKCTVSTNAVVEIPDGLEALPLQRVRPRCALMMGRLIQHKGVEYALRAVARPECRDWELVMVGDGPRDHWLRRARELGIGDRVRVVDRLPRDEVFGYLLAGDCLLLPSLRDNTPWVSAEAAASGCPVVTFATGGARELAGDLAVVVEHRRDPVGNLARAMRDLPPRGPGSRRTPWTRRRITDLLRTWYAPVPAAGSGAAAPTTVGAAPCR